MATRKSLLLFWFMTATALQAFAATPREGIVIDESAMGRTIASEQSPEKFRYPKYLHVRILEKAKSPQGTSMFRVGQIVLHHRKPTPSERIPALWVDGSHLVLFDEMRPIATCWPFRNVNFRDGVVDVEIAFNADGTGLLRQSDGEATSIPVRAFERRGVVGIRDNMGEQLFVLLTDRSLDGLSLPDERVDVEKRDCDVSPR